ncbi:MAG: hypothetical protein GY953_24765 [bacterium]|nr:hypothetical protein [bacterium]
MRIVKTVKPGQKGSKALLSRYGASLLCVRYRYDEDNRESLKTVELVVQRRSLKHEALCQGGAKRGGGSEGAGRRRVAVRIGWREKDLQSRVKSAGGHWDPVRQVWFLRHDAAERLGLVGRILGGGS